MGTPLTECLTSFLARLAYAHRLTVGDLLLHYYLPQLREERGREGFRRAFDLHKMVAANGHADDPFPGTLPRLNRAVRPGGAAKDGGQRESQSPVHG